MNSTQGALPIFSSPRREAQWLQETNFGRVSSWEVVHDGQVVAGLDYLKWADMFWYDYRVVPVEGCQELVHDRANWETCRFRYRNRDIDRFCDDAFAGGDIGDFCAGRTSVLSFRSLHFSPSSGSVEGWLRLLSVKATIRSMLGR